MPATTPTPPPAATLTFTGMRDLGVGSGFDLQFRASDKTSNLYLCIGKEDNRVQINGTTPLSRQSAVLSAIDALGKQGESIDLWMTQEKNGAAAVRTPKIKYHTPVKPFLGKLRISDIASDTPAMTYPGNGDGRLLSKQINGRFYFKYHGKFETNNQMRGFDCTSFPMALLSIPRLGGKGYGKDVAVALNATACNLEQIKSPELARKFQEDSIDYGIYILFSEGHVLLYNSDINTLYEFTYGGFKKTPAAQRPLKAKNDLWWMRKLPDRYRPFFA